jgi:hypothetical protein
MADGTVAGSGKSHCSDPAYPIRAILFLSEGMSECCWPRVFFMEKWFFWLKLQSELFLCPWEYNARQAAVLHMIVTPMRRRSFGDGRLRRALESSPLSKSSSILKNGKPRRTKTGNTK